MQVISQYMRFLAICYLEVIEHIVNPSQTDISATEMMLMQMKPDDRASVKKQIFHGLQRKWGLAS